MAWFKKNREKAVINFIDIDRDLMSIGSSVEITGSTGEKVDYDPTDDIKALEGKGYVLVKNQFNGNGTQPVYTDDTEVYLISFKHDVRAVNPNHPLTKIPIDEYDRPIRFIVNFEDTPTKLKSKVQTAHLFRTLTADKVTGERIEDGKFDTDWQLDHEKFDDIEVPVLPGVHTDIKVIEGPEVGKEDVEETVTYKPNGHLIPVDENGDEIPNVGPYQFATDENDPTKVAANQIVPDLDGYTHDQETISPQDPDKDMAVVYKAIPKQDTMYISGAGNNENTDAPQLANPQDINHPSIDDDLTEDLSKQAAAAMGMDNKVDEKGIERRSDEQMAIINFIDLDNNGKQITSSGPLYGLPGEVINNLYSTEVPMKAIEKAGFTVVFNNFDGDGQVQKFNNNHLVTQIFTVGLKHSTQDSELSDSAQALAQNQQIVRDQLKNFKPSNDSESEAVMSVANATMQLLSMFLEKNQDKKTDEANSEENDK